MRFTIGIPMRCTRAFLTVLLLTGAIAQTGCRPDPAISVSTEKTSEHVREDDPEPDEPEPAGGGERILGAYIAGPPSGGMQGWWVFKMRGKPGMLGRREADFDKFLASLRMPASDKALPAWQLPEHWQVGSASDGISLVKIKTGHPLTPVDMTLSFVGGSLFENVTRWQDQVGMPRVEEANLAKLWQERKTADGKTILRLDLKGPGGKKNAMMPPFAKN